MTTEEFLDMALELPVEERAHIAEQILRSLNRPDPDKDEKWVATAKRRLEDLKTGRVKPVDAETVFDNLIARNEA